MDHQINGGTEGTMNQWSGVNIHGFIDHQSDAWTQGTMNQLPE